MTQTLPQRVATAVAGIVADLVGKGTPGVLLLGSQARGDAQDHSDVNLVALGEGPDYSLRQEGDLLLSVSWRTPDDVRASFRNPRDAGGAVPGWGTAVVLHDADGVLSALIGEAQAWQWADIEDVRRAWIADQMTSRAENVHRIVRSLTLARHRSAAVNRDALAIRLPTVAAVHHKVLYNSQHRLFDELADLMGAQWRRSHDAALALGGESLDASCRAALELYTHLALVVDEYLDAHQREIVQSTVDLVWSRTTG